MWLLGPSSRLARLATWVYYRFAAYGTRPPTHGPVLLVANHPNSLVDAILVSAVAQRPVRFLAKAPLFSLRRIGWLLRAVGAIPVHRRVDDPSALDQNVHAFAAVFTALKDGAAIGIFPEGLSHSEPSLARMRTGAARMALGFAQREGRPLPIVPIGLVLRDKSRFRSEAAAFLGEPLAWSDLAELGDEDHGAVRELTSRIDAGLRELTLNLERWEDEPLVRIVEEIWHVEIDPADDPGTRLSRLRTTAETLASLRRSGEKTWSVLATSIETHRRRLERLRLTPQSLHSSTEFSTALAWALRRLHVLGPIAFVFAVIGAWLYWPVYQLTGRLARLGPDLEDVQSTYKLLTGLVLYPLWTFAVAGAVWLLGGPWTGIAVAVTMPLVALVGLWIREAWRGAWQDTRRYFTLRSRRSLATALRKRQAALARELQTLDALRRGGDLPDL